MSFLPPPLADAFNYGFLYWDVPILGSRLYIVFAQIASISPSRVRRLKFSRFVISDPGFLLAPTPGPDYLGMSSPLKGKRKDRVFFF